MFTKNDIKNNMRRGEALLITVTVIMALLAGTQIFAPNWYKKSECTVEVCDSKSCETQTCEEHSNKQGACHR